MADHAQAEKVLAQNGLGEVEMLLYKITMKTSTELERQAASQVLSLMAAAARTAPKSRGIDNIRVIGIEDAEAKAGLVSKMRELAKSEGRPWFERDAGCVEKSLAILLIGVVPNPTDLNCGYCGQETCEALKQVNGICAFNSIDLGIATSSAVGVAADSRIDTRIMYSVGHAGVAMNLFESGLKQALGIPLSITGKSPFFDRKA